MWNLKEYGYRIESLILSNKLLFNFVKKAIAVEHDSPDYFKIKPAIELLEKSWNQELSLKELAASCNLSISHFRHLFFNTQKMSPLKYRDTLRLLHIKDQLMVEGLSIKEIANNCGFDDVNYFNRFFKKYTGITPSQYRKS